MTDIVAVGAGFFAHYGAVPAGLLGERGDRQPRRQLHDSRTGDERAPSSLTTLVKGLSRAARGLALGGVAGGGAGASRARGGGPGLAQVVPGTRGRDRGQQDTVTDRLRGENAEQVEVGGLLVRER